MIWQFIDVALFSVDFQPFIEKHIIVSKYKIYPSVKFIVEDWENVD
jgi:hypothetical protein